MSGPRWSLLSRIWVALVYLFVTTTLIFLVVIAAMIVAQPRFPLSLGVVSTTGRAGLLVVVPPIVAAAAGLFLLRARRRLGALLIGAYSAYWALLFLAGLPRVWNARQSFCLQGLGFCIYSPWVARLTVLAIVTPFLLIAVWSARRALLAPASGDGPGPRGA